MANITAEGQYNGLASDVCGQVTMGQVAELRRDVAKAESDIRQSILTQQVSNSSEFCAINKHVSDESRSNMEEILENRAAIKDAACMIDKSVLENRSELKDVRFQLHDNIRNVGDEVKETRWKLGEKMNREFDVVKERLIGFERSVDKEFCHVKTLIKDGTQIVLNQLASDKLDEKNDEIAELRAKLSHKDLSHNNQIVNYELASLKSMINSIEQKQTFSSKTSVFGQGNLTGTAQTANQS